MSSDQPRSVPALLLPAPPDPSGRLRAEDETSAAKWLQWTETAGVRALLGGETLDRYKPSTSLFEAATETFECVAVTPCFC